MNPTDSPTSDVPGVAPPTGKPILEIIAVLVALLVGLAIGGAIFAQTGFLPASPILGMVLAVLTASFFIRRRGLGWADLGMKAPDSWGKAILWALAAIVGGLVAGQLVAWAAGQAGFAPPDASFIIDYVEGDFVHYLWFLIPISWFSAGMGEEMILRGFVLGRFNDKFGPTPRGTALAVIVQAVLFGLLHSYQGVTGVLSITALALVFGFVYLKAGRNLWATILAHAAIDSLGMTIIYTGNAALVGG